MNFYSKSSLIFLLLIISNLIVNAQYSDFNVEAYQDFLRNNIDLTTSSLLNTYNAGEFKSINSSDLESALYFNTVNTRLNLTDFEKSMISKYGFVVSERLSDVSFGAQMANIYHKDLPLFISSDAVLHAFHSSYDLILKETEISIIMGKLKTLLSKLRSGMSILEGKYSANPAMLRGLKDADVYISVPSAILSEETNPYFQNNRAFIDTLLGYIQEESPLRIKLFSENVRFVDFSQFKPRGHYDDQYYTGLADYFRAMMWFGKIEIYLLAPEALDGPSPEDIQRQSILALLISELLEDPAAKQLYIEINSVIQQFVGEQDNVTLENLEELKSSSGILSADILLDTLKLAKFQTELKTKPYADQKILSQILMSDPMSPEQIKPASAFLLFGQRFVVDSYITGSVVYDKIKFENKLMTRMLPSALDMLFSLGNDAAGQLLKPELNSFKYSSNLAGLRYLIDSYGEDFWDLSIYNGWLNSIRSLNPPQNRDNLPGFMQTAAWWQQKMNSQLVSWTQLRHDNLLYAKQSYSGGITCSYPYTYVEPIPHFWGSLSHLARRSLEAFRGFDFVYSPMIVEVMGYFEYFSNITDTLQIIAQKELDGESLNEREIKFLKQMLYEENVCGIVYDGWYTRLFFRNFGSDGFMDKDYLVADYHTAPTDADGGFVGWVKHAGTGPVDLAVIVAEYPGMGEIVFTGPVGSFREYTTDNFFRLTDSEWNKLYMNTSLRPEWTNIYLADKSGQSKGDGPSLITGVSEDNDAPIHPDYLIAQNYPNPFNISTTISFTIPSQINGAVTSLKIYDVQGREVKRLVDEILTPGNYLVNWTGSNQRGETVSTGIYFYRLTSGEIAYTGKMNLLK